MNHQLSEHLEQARLRLRHTPTAHRSAYGQYFTPLPVARTLAQLVRAEQQVVRVLDPGAGAGALLAAVVHQLCLREKPPQVIEVTAYELDSTLSIALEQTLAYCAACAASRNVAFRTTVQPVDFIGAATEQLQRPLFGEGENGYTLAILNPPYKKIATASTAYRRLAAVGLTTTNLYTGFMGLAAALLAEGGELVAITPRSFCSGSYFRPFRRYFLDRMTITAMHLFESRQQTFADDAVLQENVILAATRGKRSQSDVVLTIGDLIDAPATTRRMIAATELVHPADPEQMIRLVADAAGDHVAQQIAQLPALLVDLGLRVSTGPVVDFRLAAHLRQGVAEGAVPLIYPMHLNGTITWPKIGKKPNSLMLNDLTRGWLVPRGTYVLVKRISAKEERRRVAATVLHEGDLPGTLIGLENHLNYFHMNGHGIEPLVAVGLAAYLNSTLVDTYVRQFNGHTQINATDLRALRYPSLAALRSLGARLSDQEPSQSVIDAAVAEVLA